jgi:hypothetical protein
LDILGVLLHGNQFGSHPVNHLTLFLSTLFKATDLLGLSLHLPNEIIDHVGQLLDLDVLTVNTTIQFIHYLPYSVGGIPDKVKTLIQAINRMVLLMINLS